jgi:hypothetical protein
MKLTRSHTPGLRFPSRSTRSDSPNRNIHQRFTRLGRLRDGLELGRRWALDQGGG